MMIGGSIAIGPVKGVGSVMGSIGMGVVGITMPMQLKAIRKKFKGIKLSVYYLQACMKQCCNSLFEHHGEEIEDVSQ